MTDVQMFFDGHYPALPNNWIFAGAEPRHIPDYSAVYIIVGGDGTVKYVGQTTKMQQRYKDHKWMTRKDRIGWIKCEIEELLFMESWFIATLRPWMNSNPNKRAPKATASRSAKLDIAASRVWKCGRKARVQAGYNETHVGPIQDLNSRSAMVVGHWWSRQHVSVLLD